MFRQGVFRNPRPVHNAQSRPSNHTEPGLSGQLTGGHCGADAEERGLASCSLLTFLSRRELAGYLVGREGPGVWPDAGNILQALDSQ